jgi:hypothetical protein
MATPAVGHDAIAEVLKKWFHGFPDLHFPLEDVEVYRAVAATVRWRTGPAS